MKKILFALLAFSCLATAYTDLSFSVHMAIDENGNAHVSEKTVFSLDNTREAQAFDYLRGQSAKTLSDCTKFSKNIRYHFNSVDSKSLSIIPTKDFLKGYDAGVVTIEYDAMNVFAVEKTTTRITRYSFDASQLAFSSTGKTGEIALDKNMGLAIELPTDALNVKTLPSAGVVKEGNVLSWNGPISGSWNISFEREKALSTEVNEFFTETFEQLYSSGTLFLIILFLVFLVMLKFWRARK